MTEKLEIGEKEGHITTVATGIVTKFITIEVDGQSMISDWHPSPFAKSFQLDVGTSEIHKADVVAGPFARAKVPVDGKLAQRLAGFMTGV